MTIERIEKMFRNKGYHTPGQTLDPVSINRNILRGKPRGMSPFLRTEFFTKLSCNNKHIFSVYFLGLIFIFILTTVFIWLFNTNLTSGFTDNAYHLAVAEGFTRAGGISTWDFWNSLPLGRPQNYPPLFHLILADLIKIGFTSEIAVKLMMEFFVIGGLALFSLGITKIYNIRVAFWSVLIMAISIRFICTSITIMPSTMVLFLSPLLFYLFKEKKWISYIVILTLMLFLHLFLPLIILFALALYVIFFERNRFIIGLKASLIALILYSPWLIHIFLNGINSIKYFDSSYQISRYQTVPQINVIFVTLAIISLITLIFKKKLIKQDYFFVILLVLFVIMAFFATERTLSGHLWIYIALFTALFLDRFLDKMRILPYLTFLIFSFSIFIMPILVIDRTIFLDFSQLTVAKIILTKTYSETSKEERFHELFSDIENNSKEGEAIGTALSYFDTYLIDRGEYQSNVAIFLASNADRPTINLYQPEYFYRPLPDLTQARIILLNEKIENLTPQYFDDFGYTHPKDIEITESIKNNFVQISSYNTYYYQPINGIEIENDISKNVYLYKNTKAEIIKETIPEFVLPFWFVNSLLALLLGLLIFDLKRNKNSHL